ncbi:C2 family cysteine protease [Actinomadura luteofluorescens]|uniref:C2 family cysteine protease n=1 Tax=Actinomadura luteofluorescens TaxID=46163 RepID=UPI003D9397D5
MEHPTRTDTKVENTDRPDPPDKPPAPPRDTPGAPGYPSRRESLARAREAAPQEGGTSQVAVKDSGSRGPEERDDKLSSPQADSGKEKEEPSGPEAPDREEDAAKPDVEAGGSESGEESEQGEGGEEEHSESEEAGQTDAEPSGGESQDDRDGKLADAQTKSVGEKPETPDEPVSPKQQHTLPADNPGSPHQPSRRESLARAREFVHQERGLQEPEGVAPGSPPPAEGLGESASSAEGDRTEIESPGDQPPLFAPEQAPVTTVTSSSADGGSQDARGVVDEPAKRQEMPGADLTAAPVGEPEFPASSESSGDLSDEPNERGLAEIPPGEGAGIAEPDEYAPERGISDRLKRWAAKLDRSDRPREIEGVVDRPDFQDPEEEPEFIPDRYGMPLDQLDGTRIPLFDGMPKREQAEQGGLGDCGIIATLGAVAAARPEALRSCVHETDEGNYQVRLHEAKYSRAKQCYEPTGNSITLTVTPELPVMDDDPGKPVFAPALANTAWAPVLEKAIAGADRSWTAERWDKAKQLWKAQGNSGDSPTGYVRLNQGSTPDERSELLTQLTGLPARTVQFPSGYDRQGRSADRQLGDEIAQRLSLDKPVLVGTRELAAGESSLPKGLFAGHVYEVTKMDAQGKLHLRNPWGIDHPARMTIQELKRNVRPCYSTLE